MSFVTLKKKALNVSRVRLFLLNKGHGKKVVSSLQLIQFSSIEFYQLIIYRRIPVISPGLIQLRKGFSVGL